MLKNGLCTIPNPKSRLCQLRIGCISWEANCLADVSIQIILIEWTVTGQIGMSGWQSWEEKVRFGSKSRRDWQIKLPGHEMEQIRSM